MFRISRFLMIGLLSAQAAMFGYAPSGSSGWMGRYVATDDNFAFVDTMMLKSSRFTQTDESNATVLDAYHNTYTLHYTTAELASMGFVKRLEDDHLAVYFETDSFSAICVNKQTGYQWSTRPEFQGFTGSREDNTAARNLMNSGLWIDYVRTAKVSSSTITTASLYTLADTSYANNGAYDETNPDLTRPYMLTSGSYDYSAVTVTLRDSDASQFTADITMPTLGFAFSARIALVDGALDVRIDKTTLSETNDTYRLMGIYVFPYMGAAREDKMPGYIVIPDGVGALIRTNQKYDTYFQANYYGSDRGYDRTTITSLSVPIYGIVHQVGGNGFYANITEGSEHTSLISYLWGKNTHYQRASNRFNIRQIYRKIIDQAGDGYDAILDNRIDANFDIRFSFLGQTDASYVGIAKDYRQYLENQAVLTDREKDNGGVIPIALSYLLAEREPTFIGTVPVIMTTPKEAAAAYEDFKSEGLTNQQVTLLGWSKDGFNNRAPFRFNVRDRSAVKELSDQVQEDGNALYLDQDYLLSTNLSKRVNYANDVTRDLSKLKMTETGRSLSGSDDTLTYYYLDPQASLDKAQNDAEDFSDLGVSGLSTWSLGKYLFSYYDGAAESRSVAIAKYQQLAAQFTSVDLYAPNAYLYQYTDGYLSMPITNSQFDYYTDLVPLIPIILKGSVSYYSPALNFNATGITRLLTMVDFGINPSYILTQEATSKMRYTESSYLYTTTLDDFHDEIIDNYTYLNDALKTVLGAEIVDRTMVATGFSKVTYDNGVIIYVNYSAGALSDGTVTVPAHGYRVVS